MLNLPKISTKANRSVLFLGNGINRSFNHKSWDDLISETNETNAKCDVESIKELPYNMQIIAATNDNVDKEMKTISKILNYDINKEQADFLQMLITDEFSAIITTNYTTELEQALGMKNNKYSFYKHMQYTKADLTDKMKKSQLYNYLMIDGKSIWHIHGHIYAPSSVKMGNYYYGKLTSQIEQYISTLLRNYKASKNYDFPFVPKSWIDYFMLSDVYMLGFGMDFSESDIWYLIGAKKRHFPENKTYFYLPKEDIEEKRALTTMLKAYNVEVVDTLSSKNGFKNFYLDAVDDTKIKNCRKGLITV